MLEFPNFSQITYINVTELQELKSTNALESHSEFTSVPAPESSMLDLTLLNVIMDGDDPATTDIENPDTTAEKVDDPNEAATLEDNTSDIYILHTHKNENLKDDDENDMDYGVRKRGQKKRGRGRPKSKKKKPKQKFQCVPCDKWFGHQSSLAYHRATRHATATTKKHICTICEKVFKHKNLLKSHMDSHSDVKCYKCPQCPKEFKNR